jgi:hypothetical protein
MGEVVRFVSKSERERTRLIREARAIYDSIFPRAEAPAERLHKTPVGHLGSRANPLRNDGGLS